MAGQISSHNMKVSLLVVVLLVQMAVSQKMNTDFCAKMKPKSTSSAGIPALEWTSDFVNTAEVSNTDNLYVKMSTIAYSQTYQKVSFTETAQKHEESLWAFPRMDQLLMLQNGKCTDQTLGGSPIAQALNLHYDNNTLVLPKFKWMVAASTLETPTYIGKQTVRGMPANYWHMCGHQDWKNRTISAKLYYSEPFYTMATSKDPIPLMVKIDYNNDDAKTKTTVSLSERFDYFDFGQSVSYFSPKFKIPEQMWCEKRPDATNLPKFPWIFQFSGEQTDLGDLSSDPPAKPELTTMTEYYQYGIRMGMFSLYSEGPGDKTIAKFRERVTHTFATGLQYDQNLSNGKCDVGKIDREADYLPSIFGKVKMKTPQQFFNLDGLHYQYMGMHTDFDRGIIVDVYTSVETKNKATTVRTWYIAAPGWMIHTEGFSEAFVFPVRLTIYSSLTQSTIFFDFYEYTRSPAQKDMFPDLSSCFSPGREMYLDISFDANYYFVVQADLGAFYADFRTRMMNVTGIANLIRISSIQVFPTTDQKTLVRFVLLDKPDKQGNGLIFANSPSNADVFKKLTASIDAGTFVVDVHNLLGKYSVKATGYTQQFKDPASAAPSSGSSGSSGFSGGAMGGLAVGMLLLGLLVGFVLLKGFLVYQQRQAGPDNQQLEMKT